MKQIYHPYWEWEDYKNGLYDLEKEYSEKEENELAIKAKELLSNKTEFFNIAMKVIIEWINAAEQNLTNNNKNKQAWIGQASCCYKFKIPERITKYGWRMLSIDEQKEANKIADKNCLRKDLKVPKGYRLIEDWECLKEIRTNKELRKILICSGVWVNTKRGVRACWLGSLSGISDFYAVGHSVGYISALRGVFVKK